MLSRKRLETRALLDSERVCGERERALRRQVSAGSLVLRYLLGRRTFGRMM